jgi:hypothetical protein
MTVISDKPACRWRCLAGALLRGLRNAAEPVWLVQAITFLLPAVPWNSLLGIQLTEQFPIDLRRHNQKHATRAGAKRHAAGHRVRGEIWLIHGLTLLYRGSATTGGYYSGALGRRPTCSHLWTQASLGGARPPIFSPRPIDCRIERQWKTTDLYRLQTTPLMALTNRVGNKRSAALRPGCRSRGLFVAPSRATRA